MISSCLICSFSFGGFSKWFFSWSFWKRASSIQDQNTSLQIECWFLRFTLWIKRCCVSSVALRLSELRYISLHFLCFWFSVLNSWASFIAFIIQMSSSTQLPVSTLADLILIARISNVLAENIHLLHSYFNIKTRNKKCGGFPKTSNPSEMKSS